MVVTKPSLTNVVYKSKYFVIHDRLMYITIIRCYQSIQLMVKKKFLRCHQIDRTPVLRWCRFYLTTVSYYYIICNTTYHLYMSNNEYFIVYIWSIDGLFPDQKPWHPVLSVHRGHITNYHIWLAHLCRMYYNKRISNRSMSLSCTRSLSQRMGCRCCAQCAM